MDPVNAKPYPDVVVRRRMRGGSIKTFLSPATLKGEEWLSVNASALSRAADTGSQSSGHVVFEVDVSAVPGWVSRMEAASIVVLEERP